VPHPERRRRQLYGRRKGPRLSAHQQHLIDTLLPKLALHLQPGCDPKTYFSPPPCAEIEDIWLEVGFGAGEHLLWQALHHPHVGLIGAEPYISGIAKFLSKVQAAAPAPNIRIHAGDARDVIDALPDASLGRIFILFPDPWPKTRHHKRRFVQMELLDQLARVMKPHAELRLASDDAPYFAWALEHIRAHPSFEWAARRATDWLTRPDDWPQTRYEAKALHGEPAYLRAIRL
jgi:tRNA (guanine-N7-)-methyltransferase